MAAHNRMPFGTHVVFTYGPLGFLQEHQLNYAWTTVCGLVFNFALSAAVLGAMVWSLRRVVPLPVAMVVTFLFGAFVFEAIATPLENVLVLVLIVCVSILKRTDPDRAPSWMWMALGGTLSIFALIKVSLGVGIAAALMITLACLPCGRWRALGYLGAGAIPTFILCWFGTGNGFGNIIAFARSSAAIISGYAPAMTIDDPTRFYTYWLAALVVVLVGGFAWSHTNGMPRRSMVGIGLITLVIIWTLFKEGFVRHDAHDLIFFGAAPLVLVAFAPKRWSWALAPGVLVLSAVFLIAAIDVPLVATQPDVAVQNFFSELATVVSPSRTAAVIEQSRRSLQDTYALPSRMVAMMRGQTVDISPWEQTVAWAYPQIRFDPLPVIQDYSAYTPSLDQLDTSYLASPDAPRFILSQPGQSIDGRDPSFEPPAAQLAIQCRYHQVAGNAVWQLLEHGADRCGPAHPLGVVTTGFHRWVAVPLVPAGDAVIARFQLSQGWLSSLEAVVFKPPKVNIGYNYAHQASRFIASTGPDLHLLRPASTLGYYRGFMPVSLSRIRFVIVGRSPTTTGVKVSFFRIHVAPVPGGNGEVLPKLLTSVQRPKNGATVSGTGVLDARAADYFKVRKVEFHLTDASQHDTLVAAGGPTIYGWIALWNTAKFANGFYTLRSVAYDVAGRSSLSNGIIIAIKN